MSPKSAGSSSGKVQVRKFAEREFKIIPPHDGGPGQRAVSYSCQASPKYKRIIELLFSNALTPWKTEADVLRAFIDLGAHYYGEALGGDIVPGLLHTLDMMNRLVDEAREINDFVASIEMLDREVQRAIEGGMRDRAVGLVYKYRERAKQIGDLVLRRKIVADVNQRFGFLLKGQQGRKESEKSAARLQVDEEAHEEIGEAGESEIGEIADEIEELLEEIDGQQTES